MTVGKTIRHEQYGTGRIVRVQSREYDADIVYIKFFNGEVLPFRADSSKLTID